ncbi:hypothetical protein MPTK1_7g03650 [Marchantia polymorpha subsp. ruderalis]|uniref:Uncharacterized protein n=2 Tax=Marchantia polymorpha TaxID=3197 RepID=A0AAF6BVU2_MARPO|nr:hypothetical protein MARPO_0074s0032 [Marchantia polymorpha]BBN16126.1 hypothetical protein Mp_7g03650 [Marchantia polymorpha subsp. ruderalis]|eukprot:PTQ35040.1 hypothetical protein MARPO_0074s0032 [Marchantia polymorpha]
MHDSEESHSCASPRAKNRPRAIPRLLSVIFFCVRVLLGICCSWAVRIMDAGKSSIEVVRDTVAYLALRNKECLVQLKQDVQEFVTIVLSCVTETPLTQSL